MFDPNEEVNKEYIGMLCKVMAQLGLAATQTDFVAQVEGKGRKAEKAAKHFGKNVVFSIMRLTQELERLATK